MTIKRQQIFRLASKMLIACFVLAGTPSFATDFFDSFEITSIYEGDLPARSFKAGIPVDSTKIDDPDYYLPNTKFGAYIKTAYEKLKVDREEVLHNSSISYLPKDLKLVRRSLQIYMKETSNQSRKRDDFYVGNNGNENGREFNFSELGLPQRITRIALCFGFDPFVLRLL